MTRRAFFAGLSLLGAPRQTIAGVQQNQLQALVEDAFNPKQTDADSGLDDTLEVLPGGEGWILRGQLTEAGDIGYYAVGKNLSIVIDETSPLLSTTRPLERREVVISLKRA